MIIQCPRCSTRWRVAEPSATDNPVFKCGRCHHVFPRFPGAATGAERFVGARQRASGPPEPDNLEFIFPRRGPTAERRTAAGERRALGEERGTAAEEQHTPTEDALPIAPLRELVTDPLPAAEVLGRLTPRRRPSAAALPDRDAASALSDRDTKATVSDAEAAGAPSPQPKAQEHRAETAPETPRPEHRAGGRPELGVEDGPALGIDDRPARGDDLSIPDLDDLTIPSLDDDLVAALDDDQLGPSSIGDAVAPKGSEETAPQELGEAEPFHDDAGDVPVAASTLRSNFGGGRVLHLEDAMRAGVSQWGFGAVVRALLILVGVHAALALLIRIDPSRGADLLGRIPFIGAKLTDEPALGREILLRNVQGGYQRLKNTRTVFVISGEAVNNSLATVERIQVEGALYGPSGEVDRKVITTGNETTLRLSELSESEIALLQRFEPHATLAPGASVPFSIVFLEPPAKLREFSSRVLTARPTGHVASPPANPSRARASVG